MENIIEINYTSKDYPKSFLELKDFPKKIYCIGDITLLNKNAIAIVGTRNPSQYGEKVAYNFAKNISNNNIVVVSGLASGIDRAAHLGSMQGKAKTIAVMGTSIDKIYPEENLSLKQDIINNGGLVISERPLNEAITRKNFPKRNRLITALSNSVIVVEAKARSGSSITANYAFKQNKNVFCIPGNIYDKRFVGIIKLIEKGALYVNSVKDLFEKLKIGSTNFNETKQDLPIQKVEKKLEYKDVGKDYQPIFDCITYEPITVNELYKKLDLTISDLNTKLTFMELDGLIENIGQEKFIRV